MGGHDGYRAAAQGIPNEKITLVLRKVTDNYIPKLVKEKVRKSVLTGHQWTRSSPNHSEC